MKNPFDPVKDRINHEIFEKHYSDKFFSKIEEEIKKNINKYIEEKNPDLLTNFSLLHQEITMLIKEHQKTINFIEKKAKNIFESSSLAEDVFKMRDELKIVKKKMDKLNSGLKGFARIGDLISQDEK